MSDLISRSVYKSKLLKALDVLNKEYREAMLNEDNDLILAIQNQQSAYMIALRLLDNEQTAYDIDKVVEELKEKARTVNVIAYGNIYEAINKDVAIEIVKHGGVETETETIRDKAVKWNNNSSKRVPYEFIDYVEGKREIGVDDDVCEWRLCDEESNVYDTSCRNPHILIEGTPRENNYEFCPYCGKKIKVVD